MFTKTNKISKIIQTPLTENNFLWINVLVINKPEKQLKRDKLLKKLPYSTMNTDPAYEKAYNRVR